MPRPKPGDPILVHVDALVVVRYDYVDETGDVDEIELYDGNYRAVRRKLNRLGPHTVEHSTIVVYDVHFAASDHERYLADVLFEIPAEEWRDRGAKGYGQIGRVSNFPRSASPEP